MPEVESRLIRCFSSVFPMLAADEIRSANLPSLIEMDSLAGVTLLAVIDEEFCVQMDLDGIMALGTFQALLQHISGQDRNTAGLGEQGTP